MVATFGKKMELKTFYVCGRGDFPYDMLRWDECWPADPASASKLGITYNRDQRVVKLFSYKEPTRDRWSSFTWACAPENVWHK